jgi:hypothetical protein
VTDILKLVN